MKTTLQAVACQYGRPTDGIELRRRIHDELRRKRIRMVVIDDDPTGIQTVHGCLLITEITPQRVAEALEDEAPFFYLLVNSRAMTEQEARRVVREAVEAVPLDRILIETDCPYLAPVPYRGQMNHSGLMRYTAEAIAEVKKIRYDEVLRVTEENARKLYRI